MIAAEQLSNVPKFFCAGQRAILIDNTTNATLYLMLPYTSLLTGRIEHANLLGQMLKDLMFVIPPNISFRELPKYSSNSR